ncbi:MAG: Holliday junction resolvase RuvX, partial [Armatimonadota bacterium]|nr:Holliday junction resolvase RuvX [Armatimonadota bacterium]
MRYMGLDVGDKTIGVAVSDELGMVATPLKVIQRSSSIKKDIAQIKKLAEDYGVGVIVVGLPLMLAGTAGAQVEKVREFV